MENIGHIDFSVLTRQLQNHEFAILPGLESQMRMAPLLRRDQIRTRGKSGKAVNSSILILLYPDKTNNAHTVLIQRPSYNGIHSGQISFPGGRFEPGDKNMQETALREAHEEVGVDPDAVEIVGQLTDLYIPPSNYLVSSFVGFTNIRPPFVPDRKEVAHILEIPVAAFLVRDNLREIPMVLSGGECLETPCFLINDHTIWGATAMIMAEFADLATGIMAS